MVGPTVVTVPQPATRIYCTYFDRNYLLRALVLLRSLQRVGRPFQLWALCFDDTTYEVLSKLNEPELRPIRETDFEAGDDALLAVKPERRRIEYYFTCSPSLPRYVFKQVPDADCVTYLDADLCFYSSPEPIFDELGDDGSVLIVGHRFPERCRNLEVSGKYNVSWITFKNNAEGRRCLEDWRNDCLEWCHDWIEGDKYADQKYLDKWPERYQGVKEIQHPGAGVAPWNWMRTMWERKDGQWLVDGKPLIFYHFQSLKIINGWLYDPCSGARAYGEMPTLLASRLHGPYVSEIKKMAHFVQEHVPEFSLTSPELRTTYERRIFLSKLRRGKLLLNVDRS